MTPEQVKAALEEAEKAYWKAVDAICEKVIEENVKPFCKKHKVAFSSGMGQWGFYGREAKGRSWMEYDDEGLPQDLREILNSAHVGRFAIGTYMGSYKPENFTK